MRGGCLWGRVQGPERGETHSFLTFSLGMYGQATGSASGSAPIAALFMARGGRRRRLRLSAAGTSARSALVLVGVSPRSLATRFTCTTPSLPLDAVTFPPSHAFTHLGEPRAMSASAQFRVSVRQGGGASGDGAILISTGIGLVAILGAFIFGLQISAF